MGFIKEFKEFAVKGNAIDLAIGVIIGGGFGKVVTSIVDDLIMPVVGAIVGKPDFSSVYAVLKGVVPEGTPLEEARKITGATIFAYGNFITVIINFLLLALVVFMLVKYLNRLRKVEPEAPAAPSSTDLLLTEIRDSLAKRP